MRVYDYRYISLALFFVISLVNSFATNTLTAGAAPVEKLYKHSKYTIVLCSLADNLMMPFVLLPASYLLDQVG
jgi:hypothetical protein